MNKAFFLLLSLVSFSVAWAGIEPGQSPQHQTHKWNVVEWSVQNPSYGGNPFDLIATVTFTHLESGETRRTEMFYDGGNTWKYRFIPTQEGTWNYSTQSSDSNLNNIRGQVSVAAAEKNQKGFLVAKGNKFSWEGRGDLAITPHFVMAGDGPKSISKSIDQTIETFIKTGQFNGLHISLYCYWFNYDQELCEGLNSNSNPDLRTFRAVEEALIKARDADALVHIWMWGDADHDRNPSPFVSLNSTTDRRLQRYIAARLSAIPNWSMGYGYDLWEWVKPSELESWHQYMHAKMGWSHILGARSDLNQLTQLSEKLDYSSYEQHKPQYSTYIATINKRPTKPSFSEDRFRVAQKNGFAYKDYTFDEVRRGLWHSSMAGGVAGIWGYLNSQIVDVSYPFPEATAQQFVTYNHFFEGRFYQDMNHCNNLVLGSQNSAGQFPVIKAKDDKSAVVEAATWVREKYPQYFVDTATRSDAYEMMTTVINALRANGFDARRTLANEDLPPGDYYRWGSDALVIGKDTIYDIYISWPSPATPQASFHGNQEGELTNDLMAVGAQNAGDPKVGVCLKSSEVERYVFYTEDSTSITMNLSTMKGSQRVIAVDTKKPYKEIAVGSFEPGAHTWKAPYASDWALAVGSFSSQKKTPLARNLLQRLYLSILHRDPDYPGADGWERNLRNTATNGMSDVAHTMATSSEFKEKTQNMSFYERLDYLYQGFLGRAVDPSGVHAYLPLVERGEEATVARILCESDEFNQSLEFYNYDSDIETTYSRQLVRRLYQAVLHRDPDYPGADGHVEYVRARQLNSTKEVARAIADSAEFYDNIDGLDQRLKLAFVYRALLDRDPDPSGEAAYLPILAEGRMGDVVEAILSSEEFLNNVFSKNAEQ